MNDPVTVLVVCTANQCRSAMGEALMGRALAAAGIEAHVVSAGTHALAGIAATDEIQHAARRLGLDLADHLSRPLDDAIVAGADLICCMERFHVVEIGARWPEAVERTFTIKDLARRAVERHRHPAEPVHRWLRRVGADRRPVDLLGSDSEDDVADPTGRSLRHHRRTAQEIAAAAEAVAEGLNGPLPSRRLLA